jgi:hypothetical protein
MRRVLSLGQVWAIAAGVGMAVAAVPFAVDAANKPAKVVKRPSFDKKGRMKVAVGNRLSVKVPDGVAVTNAPDVKVPDGVAVSNTPNVKVPDGVAVTNQPTVTVANQPTQLGVRAPLDDLVHGSATIGGLNFGKLLQAEAGKRLVVTSLTFASTTGIQAADRNYSALIGIHVGSQATCDRTNGLTESRRVAVTAGDTVTLDLSAAPLVIAPGAAGPACLGAQGWLHPNNVTVYVTADGYTLPA